MAASSLATVPIAIVFAFLQRAAGGQVERARHVAGQHDAFALGRAQAKILRLLYDLQQEMHASLLLITHDLGVVATMADDVLVMYAGRVVERADVDTLFHAPQHPYTRALLGCMTGIEDDRTSPLVPIRGAPPDLRHRPPGCAFAPRCPDAISACEVETPRLRPVGLEHEAACIRAGDRLDG